MAVSIVGESRLLHTLSNPLRSYNETLRLAERRLPFNVTQLKRVAAEAVGRTQRDVCNIRKLAEGGFNRTFEISMLDGLQVIARLPYPATVPKRYTIASEVCSYVRWTFVRRYGIPVPQVFRYSTSDDNEVGTEYIIMEKMSGQEAGCVWYSMTDAQRSHLIREVVVMEARMFSIKLPASGSIYYTKDLDPQTKRIEIDGESGISGGVMSGRIFQSTGNRTTKTLPNYGDEESDNLVEPQLPQNFNALDSDEQAAAKELYRRRHTHLHYISATEKSNPNHLRAWTHPEVFLKQKLFQHATDPWEGDNITLKADLIRATQRWPNLLSESGYLETSPPPLCPLSYEQEEIDKCFEIEAEQILCDKDMEKSRMAIGVAEDGWVPPGMYNVVKEKSEDFKKEVLMAAEPEAREMIERHWPFADRDEDE
ncbi:hypothetical protein PRK78_004085 [Emydomyces testavorans]|uniref:Aminoglycoside phosphotransferase domain-containing protein n=1 Tax=Emydomyces testavorans TaxID=2070801 RepID=A0AAF0IJ69_9EURO|nr:hypothetical protein PRK78_004085 [Emydomyces testavorans]